MNTDNGSRTGTHWTCFIVKDNKSDFFVSFEGAPDKFLLNQLPKSIIYHNYKMQYKILNYVDHIAYTFSV